MLTRVGRDYSSRFKVQGLKRTVNLEHGTFNAVALSALRFLNEPATDRYLKAS